MGPVVFDNHTQRVPIKAWIKGVPWEDAALEQIRRVARLPFIHKWVAVMPDVHVGAGSTIGCVIPTKGAIMPAAVGVDIGCGMAALRFDLGRRDLGDLAALRAAIEVRVPHGRTDNGQAKDAGAWRYREAPAPVTAAWSVMAERYAWITDYHPGVTHARGLEQLGTLGTGNHFIEVCVDTEGHVWILLHSGSRGPGNKIGSYFTSLAKKLCAQWYTPLPDPDLAFLPEGTKEFSDYLVAVEWAQNYALTNRRLMLDAVHFALTETLGAVPISNLEVNCHHNYVARENHYGANVLLTRKGAVRARVGDLGIIPGSMGAQSYIVEGLGNPESFQSCSHGAGRAMSRTQAKRTFTLADHAAATVGVECRKDADVLDETPAAYKDIEAVMAAQADLVRPIHTLKQIICVKG